MSGGTVLDVVALSPSQRGMIAASAAHCDYDPYMVTLALDITSPDDPSDRLRTAAQTLCTRHPHLTAEVRSEGLPHPVLLMRDGTQPLWEQHDLRRQPDPDAAADRIRATEGNRPLDLHHGPLTRVTMLRTGETQWVLILTIHHAVIDGWSLPLVINDLAAIARGDHDTLTTPVPLRNYAAWIASRDREDAEHAWRHDADTIPGSTDMPRIGDGTVPTHAPIVGEYQLSRSETTRVENFAREHGLTISTMFQLGWARILSSMTGHDDVVFGQTSSGRHPDIDGSDRLIGGMVTTVPVRVRVDDRTPADAGRELQERTAQLRRHDWLGSAGIARAVGSGTSELFDTLLVVENTPIGNLDTGIPLGGGAEARMRRVDSPSHYPIALVPVTHGDGIIVRAECHPTDTGRGDDADTAAERLARTLVALTTASTFADTPILLPHEDPVLRGATRRTPPTSVPETVHDALSTAAHRDPHATAVIDTTGPCSFVELTTTIRHLAETLRAAGIEDGAPIGVALPRDRRVLIAPFAVAEAGGITVHIDPTQPPERMAGILADAGARYLLADTPTITALSALDDTPRILCGTPAEPGTHDTDITWTRIGRGPTPTGQLPPIAGHRRPFYVVFTSGTTGRPKGVAISHQALLNYWHHHHRHIIEPTAATLGRPMRVAHAWSTGFDAAWQPQIALLSGQCLILADETTRTDPSLLVDMLIEHRVDMIDTTPSMLHRLDDAGLLDGISGHHLSVLALGGEAISPDTWQRLRELTATDVWNCYGPTETTVECFMARVRDLPHPAIGRPLDGMTAAVLDHRLRPLPPGMMGQLAVSGPQVAEGYLGRPDETAEVFIPDPFTEGHEPRYLTGDLVRRCTDGTVAYQGRIDDQVKINGYRVEPEECAVVLRSLDGVDDAVVVVMGRDQGRAWLGAVAITTRDSSDLRAQASTQLPSYLLPRTIAAVSDIPVNRNGKTDLAEVRRVVTEAATHARATPTGDRSPALEALCTALTALTGTPPDPDLSFAELGVDSIGLMDLAARLRRRGPDGPGWTVRVKNLMDSPSIAEAAIHLVPVDTDNEAADTGPWPLPRLARTYLETVAGTTMQQLAQTAHSQCVVLPDENAPVDDLLSALVTAHPILASRLDEATACLLPGGTIPETNTVPAGTSLSQIRNMHLERLDPAGGTMMAATIRDGGDTPPLLLLTLNHLVVDVVSWRILADDIRAFAAGNPPSPEHPLPPTSTARRNREAPARTPAGPALAGHHVNPLSTDDQAPEPCHVVRQTPPTVTAAFLDPTRRPVPEDQLLGLVTAITDRRIAGSDSDRVWFTIETHGRDGMEETRALGWFTDEKTVSTMLPQTLPEDRESTTHLITHALSDARDEPDAIAATCVNYLGRFTADSTGPQGLVPWEFLPPEDVRRDMGNLGVSSLPPRYSMTITAHVAPTAHGPIVEAMFSGAGPAADLNTVERYADLWTRTLTAVVLTGTFNPDATPNTDPSQEDN